MSFIASLFARSPVRPMQQHMRAAVACAREVLPFAEAMAAGDTAAMATCRAEIVRLEHEADSIKNEIRSHLPKRLLMAVERRDMLEILDAQDSIADVAQDIAELADLRSMRPPDDMREPLLQLVRKVIETCEQAEKVIDELDELVETGFGDREVARVEAMISELMAHQHRGWPCFSRPTRATRRGRATGGNHRVVWLDRGRTHCGAFANHNDSRRLPARRRR